MAVGRVVVLLNCGLLALRGTLKNDLSLDRSKVGDLGRC